MEEIKENELDENLEQKELPEVEQLEEIEQASEVEEIQNEEENQEEYEDEIIEEQEQEESEQDIEYVQDQEIENEYITKTKSLGKLVLLVAFTAIMLISTTYTWFSAQKDIAINGLEGTVNVAEGLLVSLDAKNWTHEIDLKNPALDAGRTLDVPYVASADGTSYAAGKNNRPSEMFPVSATGVEDIDVNEEMSFYTGININGTEVYDIAKTKAHISESANGIADAQYAGFYAIDLYLQNSSSLGAGEEQGTATETLQLNTNSMLSVLTAGSAESTGLQNTARMALAIYDTEGLTNDGDTIATDTANIHVTASQSQILTAYEGQKISDIAIWEPNASTHVDHIVINNNTLKLNSTIDGLYTASTADATNNNISKFTATEVLPTYAMTAGSLNAVQQLKDYNATTGANKIGIADIYNWNITDSNSDGRDDNTGLSRQIALQTNTESDYTITQGGVRNLISVKSPGTVIYEMGDEDGVVTFKMLKNSIIKLRMYVWLEGQDVDCTTFASHGGGIKVDLGLIKKAVVGSLGEEDNTVWVSPSEIFDVEGTNEEGLHIGDFVNYDAGTWTTAEIAAIQTGVTDSLVTANGSAELPITAFQFGGFTAGSSRNGNAVPGDIQNSYDVLTTTPNDTYTYLTDASTGEALTGWRLFDIADDGSVTLISAGNPENYRLSYGTDYATISDYILTGDTTELGEENAANYQKRDWSNYLNTEQKAESVSVLTTSKLDEWYSKYIVSGGNVSSNFYDIFEEPYYKYQNIINNYSYYWLADGYGTRLGYVCGDYLWTVQWGSAGLRVLVTLSSDIQFTSTKTGTKKLTGGDLANYGGDQTYNCWRIQ